MWPTIWQFLLMARMLWRYGRDSQLLGLLLSCIWLGGASADSRVPILTEEPLSVVQKLGSSVTLHCEARPNNVSLSWRLNGRELAEADLQLLGAWLLPGGFYIQTLSELALGRYQCVASTSLGAVASVPANVTAAKLRDFEPDDQQEIEVDEGNTAVIECQLPESQPQAQVRYSVKQEWLDASRGNYLIMPSGNLQIINASMEDEGTYMCAAYNPVTQEVKTSVSTDRLRIRRSPPEGVRIIYPPTPRSVMVPKGQRLVLECVASGIPPPRVTWAKDGTDLPLANTTRFLLSNLLIDAVAEADSGTYACRADNGLGVFGPGSSSVRYHVQVTEPPQVRIELQRQSVSWGSAVRFTCLVLGNPTPSVTWLHNTRPLVASPRHRLSPRVLRVLQVGPQDDGVYQCMAENAMGSAQASAYLLTVPAGTSRTGKLPSPDILRPNEPDTPWRGGGTQVPPTCSETGGAISQAEAPVILSQPRTGRTDLYELTWKPRREGGTPVLGYNVKYRKVGDSNSNWTMMNVSGGQHKLTLAQLEPASLYEVEMAARNCAGLGHPAMMTFRTGKGRKPQGPGSQSDPPRTLPISLPRLSPPEAPDRPTVSMATETSAYVTWIPRGNRGFPIQSFRVESKKLRKGELDWVLAVDHIPPSRLSVEVSGLEKGMSYKFRVRAVNVLGESPPSAPSKAYAVVGGGHNPPKRPVNGPYITYNEAINETTIILKWTYTPLTNNTPIYGFYIFYRPTDSDNDSDYKKDVVKGDQYWHSITDLQPETAYDIKMQCFNEGGESEYGNVVILETKARRHPRPLPTEPPTQSAEHPGGPVPRPSDLPYLIVGVVLGAFVFIIVAFIPLCLWRAWSKQKQTPDLCFPASTASCHYTVVPLQGFALVGPHHTDGPLPQGERPSEAKRPTYFLPDPPQEEEEPQLEDDTLLPQPGSYHSCSSHGQEKSYLPDDSTQQLLNTSDQPLSSGDSEARHLRGCVTSRMDASADLPCCSAVTPTGGSQPLKESSSPVFSHNTLRQEVGGRHSGTWPEENRMVDFLEA
ncbi:brother of CDO [Paramormyrops kingsleyae]|uniref:brother of CDO n=1 Tax=Paramormyrops kingsleyae TaxID=1676925 RepID=UPI003B977408